MKLSIAMIVKDEERNLEKTLIPLKKIQDYIDTEIVIVDTGSTDNTVEIAKNYTNKVYFHNWNNNFAAMRNISINYCTGDWILILDADEVLYDIDELVNLLNSNSLNDFNAVLLKRIEFLKSVEYSISNGYISPILRLFKKNTISYEGTIHEQPKFNYPVMESSIRFIHYGYDNNDYEVMEYKFKRNLSLLLGELKDDPDSVYINFQIAVSYTMHNQLKEALEYIEIAYEKGKKNINKYLYVIDKYCFILYNMGNYNALIDKAIEGIKYCNDFLDFYFYLGEAYFNLKQYNSAIEIYSKYLKFHERFNDTLVMPNNTLAVMTRRYKENIIYNLSLSYYKNKCFKESLDTIKTIEDSNLIRQKIVFLIKIIVEGNLYNEINIVEKYIDKYNYENLLLFVYKEISVENLKKLNNIKLYEKLHEIFFLVKYFKENDSMDEKIAEDIKKIIDKAQQPYSIYVYHILKYNIHEIKNLINFGKDKIENILINLCITYFDFNGVILQGLNKIRPNNISNILIRTVMEKSLIVASNLPVNERENIFLNYIADKYFVILKLYNESSMERYWWILPSEERGIIKLKEGLSYKYKDSLRYIQYMKSIINEERIYIDYVKVLIEEDYDFVLNNELKAFIPELVTNIQLLINNEKYQEAYNTIEEGLSLVKFDFELMLLKYNLLLKFNYEEEALKCLRDIILYGDKEEVSKLIKNI
ncbi:glycosyltransferase family 2 protein [Clostridium sporogenes]|uniref:Glycosyl transferase n=4 Tax=Clostridium TaxID=1485 RepID=A0AAU8YUB7_CLOBO|nr:glycosyltransferase family 2 protein [Clostridium sporogenes]AVP64066.1 glycosyl transferase [Clostridium botulinum]MBW5456406.1 glycosyltransferase [Clostridium sporogenes]MCF4016650.1 glycosyltransferase [Clostridium sporogenes]MDS1006803.1 glycosyltransferase [Clostridium sporogenes]NFG03775.1 glycosyltransferase [Clostridium sporogenes]